VLAPSDRSVLTDALPPPEGYRFDRLLGTTYTMDLVALLTLPLSFALSRGGGLDDRGRADPLALLDALRRFARRILVFCEGGRIGVPTRRQLLFGYLEDSIVEARAPLGGAFHPKVLIGRYLVDPTDPHWEDSEAPAEDAVRYRLLCSTRNLTYDRSWDTVLVLEGDLATGRTNAFARNRRLAEFVAALAGCAVRPLSAEHAAVVDLMADELLRVAFEPPEGFEAGKDDLAFWPIGIGDEEVWPFTGRTDRLLVVSPFVDRTCLDWLSGEGQLAAVVSRPEELDRLPRGALVEVEQTFVLADAVLGETDETDTAEGGSGEDDAGEPRGDVFEVIPSGPPMRGLHAKLFVADVGWHSRVWTGSANATSAAFTRNVEFLVELRGKKSKVGIGALLAEGAEEGGRDRSPTFRDLLVPYRPPEVPSEEDPSAKELERLLDVARAAWLEARIEARVTASPDADPPLHDLAYRATGPSGPVLPAGVVAWIRPLTLTPSDNRQVAGLTGEIAVFRERACETLTAFAVVSLTARADPGALSSSFVLDVPLLGAPEDRLRRLLLSLLSNRERLFRYLLMLLSDDPTGWVGNGSGAWHEGAAIGALSSAVPLLETLLRTSASAPGRLEPVERLVRDLEATAGGCDLLPPEFVAVWHAVREATRGRR
jgi:hypothetical protein